MARLIPAMAEGLACLAAYIQGKRLGARVHCSVQGSVAIAANRLFSECEQGDRSGKLWPLFLVRIPSIAPPEVQRTVLEEHLDCDDVAAMLRRFARKSVADPFELRPDPDANELVGSN